MTCVSSWDFHEASTLKLHYRAGVLVASGVATASDVQKVAKVAELLGAQRVEFAKTTKKKRKKKRAKGLQSR